MSARLYILFLITVIASPLSLLGQELVVYTMPAPKNMDWSSPSRLVKSVAKNTLTWSPYGKNRHAIGHMLISLKDDTRYELVAMTTGNDDRISNKIFIKGYGMGILFATLKGRMDLKDINEPQVKRRLEKGDIAFVKYKVSQPVFDRMWNYLKEFRERRYDTIYNGCNSPREGGGTGCSAFVHSFLEVGGIDSFLPTSEWEVRVRVPETCIGGPPGGEKKVSLLKVLRTKSWANGPLEPYQNLSFIEPTLFFHWINNQSEKLIDNVTIFSVTEGKAKGLLIDCTHVPPPDEPIWVNSK